jgi:hypothetical protein
VSKWQRENREAYNAAWRRWYRENKARKLAWQKRRRAELRAWWIEFKSTKSCEQCGESAPECLHFHHIDPTTKDFNLSEAATRISASKERILAEVAKCRVLCANCHFKLHWDD